MRDRFVALLSSSGIARVRIEDCDGFMGYFTIAIFMDGHEIYYGRIIIDPGCSPDDDCVALIVELALSNLDEMRRLSVLEGRS